METKPVVRAILPAILACAIPAMTLDRAGADCAIVADPLENSASILDAGGSISGSASFAPAVKGNGVILAGSGYVNYSSTAFNASTGTVTMWIRKNAIDTNGGLFQIGILGQPNSVGVAYADDDDIKFEAFAPGGLSATVVAGNQLSLSSWIHLTATWRSDPDGTDIWLFIDGRFQGYNRLDAPLNPSVSQTQVGIGGTYGLANIRVDEFRFFDWRLTDDEVYAEYVVSADRHLPMPTAKPQSAGPVQVAGKSLFVNGQPYTVKGVGYQPIPIGSDIDQAVIDYIYTNPEILQRDMTLLRAMGANTIRTWTQPPDEALLDACYNGGIHPIHVIVGFWVPQHAGVNYSHPATAAAIEADFRALVNQFKAHPAVLAWGIGNENNLTYARPLSEWYSLANTLAAAAYEEEGASYHPCIIVNGGMRDLGDTAHDSDDASLDMVDIWGANIYPGGSFHCSFIYFDDLSTKPLVATEYGIDALDNRIQLEYEAVHSQYIVAQWRELHGGCLGGTVMAFTDEWWKAGNPAVQDPGGYGTGFHPDGFSNEEWWGIFRPVDNGPGPDVLQPRQAVDDLAAEFLGPPGDMNCDGAIDAADVERFARALTNAEEYDLTSPECPSFKADMNADLLTNGADVAGFVDVLLSFVTP